MPSKVAELAHWQQWGYVERFKDYINRLSVSHAASVYEPGIYVDGFDEEFAVLVQFDREVMSDPNEFLTGCLEINRQKNRFPNVIANDRTRVRLPATPGEVEHAETDYINANLIDGLPEFKIPNCYIAAQAPLEDTLPDWWRMVWYYKAGTIVQLCDMFECGRQKMCPYVPKRLGNTIRSGYFSVLLAEQATLNGYIQSKLVLRNHLSGVSRPVWHFHVTDWPSFGVPKRYVGLLDTMASINLLGSNHEKPIVVHCSGGIGRTGVFIGAHVGIARYLAGLSFSVSDIVKILKSYRSGMVQTKEQYVFLYRLLLAGVERINRELFKASRHAPHIPLQGLEYKAANPLPPCSVAPPVLVGPVHPMSPVRPRHRNDNRLR